MFHDVMASCSCFLLDATAGRGKGGTAVKVIKLGRLGYKLGKRIPWRRNHLWGGRRRRGWGGRRRRGWGGRRRRGWGGRRRRGWGGRRRRGWGGRRRRGWGKK